MAYDGSLKFDTKIDSSGFASGIANIKSVALKAVSAIGAAFASGAIVHGMITAGKQSIELASDLTEVQNVVDVTFGEGASKINEFASSAKASFGLSELMAKQFTGTMGAMLKSMGLASSEVEEMSTSMTGLAGDFASFYNITQEEAFQKIRAGIAGETEPLRQLGINMSVANLEAYALAQGIDTAYASMTQAQQATLRYNYLMSVSADAQGDFARTSDSYANSQRLAALATDELKAAIGNRLLPIAAKFQQEFAKIATSATEAFNARGISGMIDVITDRFPVATAVVSGLAAAFAALLIMKSIIPLVVALQTAQVQLTLGLMRTNAAALLQANELTVLQIIVGVFTGKVKLAAAAQSLFAAVTTTVSGVVGLATVAIGALVAAIVLTQKSFEKLHPEIVEVQDNIDELNSTMKESSERYDETTDSIERQRYVANELINTLESMSASYSGSSIEQRKMQAACDTLNSSVDGMSVSFDTNTGKLSENADALRDLVSEQYAAAQSSAAVGRYNELFNEKFNAKYVMDQAKKAADSIGKMSLGALDAFAPWNAAASEAQSNLEEATDAYDSAEKSFNAYVQWLEDQGISIEGVTGATDELVDSTEDLQDVVTTSIGGLEFSQETLDSLGMTADEVSARFDNLTGAATNMFEKIDTKARIRVKTMIENLTANTAAIEQWGDNIALLGAKLPEDLLQPLIDQGPEKMAGVLNALAKASPEELDALVAQFNAGGEAAREAWLQSLGAGASEEESPLATALEDSTDAAKKAGEEAGAALVQSISEQDYTEATGTMTDAFTEAFRQIKEAFAEMLQRIHYDLAYAIGGVSIDIAQMARDVNAALSSIKTSITIRVNTIYTSEGSPGSSGGGGTSKVTLPSASQISANASSAITAAKISSSVGASAGKTVNVSAPITVQGVTESPAKLAAKVTKNLQEMLYANT